jgi:uncharacterized membrane protein YdjX (TVP38/TMEM64 family)
MTVTWINHLEATLGFWFIGVLLLSLALLPSVGFAGLVGYLTPQIGLSLGLTAAGVFLATWLGIVWMNAACGSSVESVFQTRPSWHDQYRKIQNADPRELSKVLIVLRLSPHMPFALTNLAVAQLRLSTFSKVVYSWLGLLPRSLLATYLGHSFESISAALNIQTDLRTAVATTAIVMIYLTYKLRNLLKHEPAVAKK